MIGSLIGGMIGQGGANQAAGLAQGAGAQGLANSQAQARANTSNASPYTALGIRGASVLGGLLGYGSLVNPGGDGATYDFQTDPNAYGTAGYNLNAFRQATNATIPTLASANTSNAVSGTFQADPSYDWRVSEGNKALDRSAASRGMLLSGAQAKGLTDYNQNAASQEYGNWYQRLMAQNQYNLGVNQFNNANAQWTYGANEGQYNNALNAVTGMAGMGNSAQANLAGANGAMTSAGNNAFMQGNLAAGQDYQAGANALASGIGQGMNNALFAAGMLNPGGIFNNSIFSRGAGGGRSSYPGSGTTS